MSDVKLTLDSVTIEGVNIKHVNKASSILDTNYNNSAKKELKDTTKRLDCMDKWIEGLSAISNKNKYARKKSYEYISDWLEALAEVAGFDNYSFDILYTAEDAARYYSKIKKQARTVDELILACNTYAEYLEKNLVNLQTKLETKLTDDKWLLHLTFSKYCYIDVKGAVAKKVYEILSDKENHTFVFRLDPNDAKDADWLYHLTLTAVDAEEV